MRKFGYKSSCTYKKCSRYKKSFLEPATFDQVELIKSLKKQVTDDTDVDYRTISKAEASALIERLLELKELGS